MAAPALVSRSLRNAEFRADDRLTELLSSPLMARLLQAASAAEMAADKTSWVPARIAWPLLAWRVVVGGVAGSVVAGRQGASRLAGAALAAAAAVGAAYGAYYLRKALHDRLHLPQRVLGAAEDSIVVGAGQRLLATG
jgi:uncharacterized membrane protein